MSVNLDQINVNEYEFSGEELGELLLASVKQMKAGHYRTTVVNDAIVARQKTGLSQAEFAKIMGISVRTLQGWEQGKRTPSGAAATLLKIATRYPETLMSLA